MSQEKIFVLLDKYAAGTITEAEQHELATGLQSMDEQAFREVMDRYARTVEQSGASGAPDAVLFEQIKERIAGMEAEMRPARPRARYYAAAAAVLLLLLSAGVYLFTRQPEQTTALKPAVDTLQQEIGPGGNKAVLTLANGATIVLDEAANGTLAQQGGSKVVKLGNGQLAYVGEGAAGANVFNAIATPRGGQYRVALSDGTQVWLNAASSIRYPAVFGVDERRVEITGEAYFEVARDEKKPFKVVINQSTAIHVLGTHFNINAYGDEANIRTTLLEGKVSISVFEKQQLLKPGQQGTVIYGNSGGYVAVKEVDTEEAIAWKNGMFSFKNADLPTVMRQLSRWYDVEVAYEGGRSGVLFEGKIQRELNLADVLEALRKNNVQFRIEGRKIIVKQ